MRVDLSIAIGGFQGGGIESAGQIAVRAFAIKGHEVFGSREYHSNIVGAHSYYHIRVGGKALRMPLDALIALDAESVFTHFRNLRKKAVLVCDKGSLEKKASEIPSMSRELKSRIEAAYGSVTLGQILEKLELNLVTLPMAELIGKLSETVKKPMSSVSRALNVMGLSAGLYLLGLDESTIRKAVEKQFQSPEINLAAVEIALEEVAGMERGEIPDGIRREKLILTGCEAVALSKLFSRIEFMSFYPITPATDEALFLEENRGKTITVQAEDEISAIGMALGASIAGLRAAVTTSGPGVSLMNEMISLAVQAEIPIVITLWMRASPSTGIATRTGQQDLLHAIFSGHGDPFKAVIASGDHEEAIEDVRLSFKLAEDFQMPVVHLLDKYIASSLAAVEREKFAPLPKREFSAPSENYLRYMITEDGISPFLPVGMATMIVSSLEHNEYGFASEDPVLREEMMLKRIRKFRKLAENVAEKSYSVYGERNAEMTIISFGSTKNAILEAIEQSEFHTKFLQLRILWPFPDISDEISGKVLCIESNSGQLSFLLNCCCKIDCVARKLNARPIYVNEVHRAIEEALSGRREVILGEGA